MRLIKVKKKKLSYSCYDAPSSFPSFFFASVVICVWRFSFLAPPTYTANQAAPALPAATPAEPQQSSTPGRRQLSTSQWSAPLWAPQDKLSYFNFSIVRSILSSALILYYYYQLTWTAGWPVASRGQISPLPVLTFGSNINFIYLSKARIVVVFPVSR